MEGLPLRNPSSGGEPLADHFQLTVLHHDADHGTEAQVGPVLFCVPEVDETLARSTEAQNR